MEFLNLGTQGSDVASPAAVSDSPVHEELVAIHSSVDLEGPT